MTQWQFYKGNYGAVTFGMIFLFLLTSGMELYRCSEDWWYGLFFLVIAFIFIPIAHYFSWKKKKHNFK